MNMRIKLENDLIHSMSRYIGYTTGAFNIRRFVGLLDRVKDRPYAYQFELMDVLTNTVGENYARGILDFVIALGLLRKIGNDRLVNKPKITRYELTAYGKAVKAANHFLDTSMMNDLLALILAEQDADLYCLVLEYCQVTRNMSMEDYATTRLRVMRQKRVDWINEQIPNKLLKKKIANNLSWVKTIANTITLDNELLSESFIKHHVTPRRGWAIDLGHIDSSSKLLTSEGEKYLSRFTSGSDYEWIGPSKDVADKLKIKLPSYALIGTATELFRRNENAANSNFIGDHISHEDRLYHLMINSFHQIKLHNANQAPIEVIKLFSYVIEYQTGHQFDTDKIIHNIIKKHSKTISAMSSRNSPIGYYQIRK